MRSVDKVILHCSASDLPHQTAEMIDNWHRARGFAKIGYHYFITKVGVVQKGRDEAEIGAHVEGHNASSIGICLAGLVRFEEAQLEALRSLLAELKARYPGASLHGHKEFNPGKTCPVFNYAPFVREWATKELIEAPKELRWQKYSTLFKRVWSLLAGSK